MHSLRLPFLLKSNPIQSFNIHPSHAFQGHLVRSTGYVPFRPQCPIQAFNISPSRVSWPSFRYPCSVLFLISPQLANNIYTISCLLGPDDPDIATGLVKIKLQEQVSIKKAIRQFLQVSDHKASQENNPNLIPHRGRPVRICTNESFSLSL